MKFKISGFVFFILLTSKIGFAVDTVFIDKTMKEFEASVYFEYLEDENKTIGIDAVFSPALEKRWIRNRSESPGFGMTHSAFWIRMTVCNQTDTDLKMMLFIQDPGIYLAQMYTFENSSQSTYQYAQSGISLTQSEKTIPGSRVIFPLSIDSKKTKAVYFRIVSHDFLSPKIVIKESKYAEEELNNFRFLMGIFYGIIFFIILYMLILYITFRHSSYLYFSLYSFFFALIAGAYDGFTAEYLPILVWLTDSHQNFYSSVFTVVFALLFLRSALNLSLVTKKLDTYYSIFFTSLFLILIYSFFDSKNAAYLLIFSVIIYLFLVAYIFFIAYKYKAKQMRNFLISFLVLGTFTITSVLFLFKIIPYSFLSAYSLHIGYIVHLFILTFILGNQIIMKRVETVTKELEEVKINEELTRRQNEELEIKVIERTKVLEDALERQEELNQELSSSQEELRQNLAFVSEIKAKLEESETNFKTSIDSSLQYVVLLDREARIIIADKKFTDETFIAFGKEVKPGHKITDYMPENAHELFLQHFHSALEGKLVRQEREIKISPESTYWLDIVYAPVISEEQHVKGIVLSYLDITERKKTENLLRTNQLLISSINQNMKEGIYRSTVKTGLIYANRAFAEMFGYKSVEELMSASSLDLYAYPEERAKFIQEAADQSGIKNQEILMKRKDGSIFWAYLSCVLNEDENGIQYTDGSITDITEQKKNQEQLTAQNEELQKLNDELDRFVYSASHDLRAPIASAMGLVNVMKEEKDTSQYALYLQLMEKTLQKLDYFVRDVIHYSRNTRLEVFKDEIDFKELIESVYEQYEFLDNSEKIEKTVSVNQDVIFISDKKRLSVIFNNLISNAIRYSNPYRDKPFIRINIEVNTEKATITISDNGQGIDEEHLTRIFDMFYRANDKVVGSGLGLYIVKETLQKIKGTIAVESVIDKGTTFYIEILNLKDE